MGEIPIGSGGMYYLGSPGSYEYTLCPQMPVAEQEAFFVEALPQTAAVVNTTRRLTGPCYGIIQKALELSQQQLRALEGVGLTAENIKPYTYLSNADREAVDALSPEVKGMIHPLRKSRIMDLRTAAQEHLVERLRRQTLPKGLLSDPPYCWQNQDFESAPTHITCVNACFRMIFAGLTGQRLNQNVVVKQLTDHYSTSIVDDQAYWDILHTPAFQKLCPKEVKVVEILGADLQVIAKIASSVRKEHADAAVYCMVSLASGFEEKYEVTWHSCMLLGTAADLFVVAHDPAELRSNATEASRARSSPFAGQLHSIERSLSLQSSYVLG